MRTNRSSASWLVLAALAIFNLQPATAFAQGTTAFTYQGQLADGGTNANDVLAKVAALPITQWKYKIEPDAVKHIGPVAQDFHAAFGLGDNDRTIGTVDESGVALAAIQGLNQKVDEQLKAKDAEIRDLKARLEKLEQVLETRNAGGQ